MRQNLCRYGSSPEPHSLVILVANPCHARKFYGTEISGYCSFASASVFQLLILRGVTGVRSWTKDFVMLGTRPPNCTGVGLQLVSFSFLTVATSPARPPPPYQKLDCSWCLHSTHSPRYPDGFNVQKVIDQNRKFFSDRLYPPPAPYTIIQLESLGWVDG